MKNLTLIYISALTVIALVIGASQYLVQRSISTSIYDSRTINISGRQAMLSQKISKAALAMETAESKYEFHRWQNELKEATDLWEMSHNALQYGNQEMQLHNVNNSEQTLLYFLELEAHYVEIRSAVSELLALEYQGGQQAEIVESNVNRIMTNEGPFLELMNAITLDYDTESRDRVDELSRIEYILLAVALLLLILEGLFIFRPVINRVIVYTRKLVQKEESLKRALDQQKKERAKVEYLNKQAESVFKNVEQGLFLLNEGYTISELYSASLEKIFKKDQLGGSNFLDIMKPRLLKRNHEALRMFVKHLFNPSIKENVLARLNPVNEVEIFDNMEDASIVSRYIRINFSRITDGRRILTVLVTVTDITEEVRMQQFMAESEEKNKKESEQLLSVLKIEPLTLKNFLEETKQGLESISERYERDKDANLTELISFTFRTIHNLKGNATLIDLDLMAVKLHEIENVVVELKNQPMLENHDFLKILYDINNLTQVVANMQRMMFRIAEVNATMNNEEVVEKGNQKLFNILKKGLNRMSVDLTKKVDFRFIDNGVTIPEPHIVALKDIAVQLFRNSLTHGIEDEMDRIKKGKPNRATIRMEIRRHGEKIKVLYQDDGKGLDRKEIIKVALENDLLTREEAKGMTFDEMVKLIFGEGFSTAHDVTQYAGRGQGLSLVHEIVNRQLGTYHITSKPGHSFAMEFLFPAHIGITEIV